MADLKKLAEDIVGLTLLEAQELKTILKDEYGIEPAAAAAVMAHESKKILGTELLSKAHDSSHLQQFRRQDCLCLNRISLSFVQHNF